MYRFFGPVFLSLLSLFTQAESLQLDIRPLKDAPVHYGIPQQMTTFPLPVIAWQRAGLSNGEADIRNIKTKILYPAIQHSKKPVSAIVVTFMPENTQAISVLIMWSDGDIREAMINRNTQGGFDDKAYEALFGKPVF